MKNNSEIIIKISNYLIKNKYNLSVAESCTGGMLSNEITNIPGSSKYFNLGIISYSNESKINILKIKKKIIENYGAVSKKIAYEMVLGVKKISNSNICVSITGISGPLGGSKYKPVGLVYFGFYFLDKYYIKKKIFIGNRENIKKNAVKFVFLYLLEKIKYKIKIKGEI